MKDGKKALLNTITKLAYTTASREANTVCNLIFYQDKLPEKVKTLRKH